MHDRRLNGETYTFGNEVALFMNAMTWFDHETFSIWSQPWGTAIMGELTGASLDMIPATVVTWEAWRKEHPDTQVLRITTFDDAPFSGVPRQYASGSFVVGAFVENVPKGYWYPTLMEERLVHDEIGETPVVVVTDPDSGVYAMFQRNAGGKTLTFRWGDGRLVDNETGTTWDPVLGVAQAGELQGHRLSRVPTITSYDWAWWDFHPDTEIYGYPQIEETPGGEPGAIIG